MGSFAHLIGADLYAVKWLKENELKAINNDKSHGFSLIRIKDLSSLLDDKMIQPIYEAVHVNWSHYQTQNYRHIYFKLIRMISKLEDSEALRSKLSRTFRQSELDAMIALIQTNIESHKEPARLNSE